jgi:hypothetical protein
MVNASSKSRSQVNTATASTALANVLALPSVTTTSTRLRVSGPMSREEWIELGVQIGWFGETTQSATQWWKGDWWRIGVEHEWEWGEGCERVEARFQRGSDDIRRG